MKKFSCLLFVLFGLFPAISGVTQDLKQKFELSPSREINDSRFTVTATVMDNDTWCRVTWPDPVSNPWEIVYDDGEADDYFIYANAGSMNALKFSPYQDNYIVTGGKIHVGDGSFPGPFLGTSFRVLVYDDDGEDGLPGTALDSTEVTVENYEWVEFEGLTAQITEGSFYLAMKQTAPAPDAAPIGVDTDIPIYFRSYSYFLGATGWVQSPLQDFMIRAFITGYNEPSRAIDSFEVNRFYGFEMNESPLQGDTTILDTISLSEYNDYSFDTLDPGLYAYGVKTHFTGGEWSDYDVSNTVMHIFYAFPPTCFFQADTGNQPLIICPPVDLNGALPNFFLGYNVYVDGYLIDLLPPSATSYLPSVEQPGIYICWLTAVYELSIFGFPNETVESSALTTEYILRYGYPLPFLEQWNSGTFETNNWVTDGSNWSITGQQGNPSPAAEFTWDPVQAEYALALESYPLQADSMTEGSIYLDFAIKLDNVNASGTEQMLVQVWNWESQSWATVHSYSNTDGSFSWISEHLDITAQSMGTVFKIRFLALGENSVNILSWFVDNIHVYRDCEQPDNLTINWDYQFHYIELDWDGPDDLDDVWIHWDDGENSGNSIGGPYIFDVAARWTPAQLADYDGAELTQISFFPGEELSTYNVRVWVGSGEPNLVVDQLVENPVINQWNNIALNNPLQIDISQDLWVGYHIDCETGYPAGVDDGPAIDGYGNMIYYGGWSTTLEINPELDYNWNIAAYIQQDSIISNIVKYAIYRSDDFEPYFLRDYSDQSFYQDDSICEGVLYHEYTVTALYINENDTCESDFSNEVLELCIGIVDNDKGTLKIYPNPASESIQIESSENMQSISIFDSRGDKVIGWYGDKVGKVEIPVSGLAPGLYLVRVETERELIMRKVLIMR